eukprot:1176558-Prorocentrum_minimum.AAC.1
MARFWKERADLTRFAKADFRKQLPLAKCSVSPKTLNPTLPSPRSLRIRSASNPRGSRGGPEGVQRGSRGGFVYCLFGFAFARKSLLSRSRYACVCVCVCVCVCARSPSINRGVTADVSGSARAEGCQGTWTQAKEWCAPTDWSIVRMYPRFLRFTGPPVPITARMHSTPQML